MIEFLFPNFLWALSLLAIPIIIHLFYFRRFKKVYFTNLSFLREVKEETSSRNKLKNLLVLFARLLALFFLVMAFAQPFIPMNSSVATGKKSVSIFIDNSFSMNAMADDISLLNKAKTKAQEIINAYGDEQRFQILSNSFSAAEQRLLSKEEAITAIDQIVERPEVQKLSSILNRQQQALDYADSEQKLFYILSDFQKNITEPIIPRDSSEIISLLPFKSIQEINVSIDSSWFISKVPILNQNNQLAVKLTNHSNEDKQGVRLSLLYDNQEKPLGLKKIRANRSMIDTVNINLTKTGWNTAEFKIEDYPIQFDDNYKIAFEVKEKLKVLGLYDDIQNQFLNALLKGISNIDANYVQLNRVDYAGLKDNELIILDDLTQINTGLGSELRSFVEDGGSLLLFPSENADLITWNRFLSTLGIANIEAFRNEDMEVGEINTDEFLFKDVFQENRTNFKLPVVSGFFPASGSPRLPEEKILSFRNGMTYLGKHSLGQGNIYFCYSPLKENYNDLVQNAEIFVPMIFKMAVSSGSNEELAFTIGKNRIIEVQNSLENKDMVFRISGKEEFIPRQFNTGNMANLQLGDQIIEEGFYDLKSGNETIRIIALNYDQLESELDFYSIDELNDLFPGNIQIIEEAADMNITQIISENAEGVSLWKWCIIFTLVFLAIEQLLLRLLKS